MNGNHDIMIFLKCFVDLEKIKKLEEIFMKTTWPNLDLFFRASKSKYGCSLEKTNLNFFYLIIVG